MTKPDPLNLVDYLERGAVLSMPDRVCFRDQDRTYTLARIRRAARQIGAAIATHMGEPNHPHLVAPNI